MISILEEGKSEGKLRGVSSANFLLINEYFATANIQNDGHFMDRKFSHGSNYVNPQNDLWPKNVVYPLLIYLNFLSYDQTIIIKCYRNILD